MPTFHDLRIRRRELLNELDQMAETVAELTALLDGIAEHRAWLQRQQAGALVILHETERALLEFGTDDWDEI
jgi:hypothetical protein